MNFLKIEEFTSIEAWRASFIEFLAAALFVFLGAGPLVRHGVPDRRRTNGPTAIHHCVGSRTSDSVPSVRHCQYIGWAHEPRGDICGCGEQKDQRSARTDVRLRAVGWGSRRSITPLSHDPRCRRHESRRSCPGSGCFDLHGVGDGDSSHVRSGVRDIRDCSGPKWNRAISSLSHRISRGRRPHGCDPDHGCFYESGPKLWAGFSIR